MANKKSSNLKSIILQLSVVLLIVVGYFLIDFNNIYQSLKGEVKYITQDKQCDLHKTSCKIQIQDGTTFTLNAGDYHSDYEIKLLGEHQISNAALAVVAAKVVSKKDNRIHEVALHQGVAHTFWPGRIERVKENPDVILDGAHNPSGAKALRAALNKYYPNKRVSFILGFMKDKEVEKILKELLTVKDRVFAVKADDSERALASEKVANKADVAMADLTHSFQTAKAFKDLESAFTSAEESTAKDDIICVCGSLYLVGAFKAWQLKNK